MLTLGGKVISIKVSENIGYYRVVRLSEDSNLPETLRSQQAFLTHTANIPNGFGLYVLLERDESLSARLPGEANVATIPDSYEYLRDGDVIRLSTNKGRIRVLYRRNSKHNSFLLTERCNSYCLMCSQPPKDIDDSWIVNEMLETIPLIDPDTEEIGFTGGEPTLLGHDLIKILASCRDHLPKTAVHVLSNGRRFSNFNFAKEYAQIGHPDLMVGIPIYSDISTEHDYVVQADGAYDETIRGILNLKRLYQKVEIRVVLHKQTYRQLPRLASFIVRNLLFVDHVALMGLEMQGFTRANLDALWIDPWDYQSELLEAVNILNNRHINVSIYNHQLCVLKKELWPFARKSISDWKNEYMPECDPCQFKDQCGGFFSSAKLRYSAHIAPFSTR